MVRYGHDRRRVTLLPLDYPWVMIKKNYKKKIFGSQKQ